MKLRVAGIVGDSIVDGPGVRLALFVQGCSRSCPGCHNPEARDPRGGVEMTVHEILNRVKAARHIDGVTFTGGEPFEQAAPLAVLAREIRRMGLSLVIYSGYTFEELQEKGRQEPAVQELLALGNLLVDGPYLEQERDLALPFRGSRNQRILDLECSLSARFPVKSKYML